MPEEKQEYLISPEEEIKALEQKLEAKKKELSDRQEQVPEKDVFREILKEHINKSRANLPAQPTHGAVAPTKKTGNNESAIKEEQIKRLIEIALGRSIAAAIRIAEAESPYLLDELHDNLVDHYYEKLLALRKIKRL